jgi:septum formation protein
LHSAAALARNGALVWDGGDVARLAVRALSPAFIDSYLDAEWPEVSHCVGVFRIEARGVQLFESIDGDHFTVLGMPLLQVLGALRALGELPA